MNESTLTQLKILVERAVRPVRASWSSKRKMREELLAHVTAVFEEEAARLADEQAALEQTAQRFGDPGELTRQLQESVPRLDSVRRLVDRFSDWTSLQSGESTLRRAVRYTINMELLTLLCVLPLLLLLWARLGEFSTNALWYTWPVLLICGYLGFSIGLLQSSLRRLLRNPTRRSWLQFALVVAGSTIVSMTLGLLTYGYSPNKAVWLFFFTVVIPVALAWALAHHFTARKPSCEDWASLQIE